MSRTCYILLGVGAAIQVAALGLLALGTWGPYRAPLAGVFLILLGLAWHRMGRGAVSAVLCPAINLGRPALIRRRASRR